MTPMFDPTDEKKSRLQEAKELAESDDPELKAMAEEELKKLAKEMMGPDTKYGRNVILEVRAGVGGDEAELWAGELFRMYIRYGTNKGWPVDIVSTDTTPIGGMKSAVAVIKGPDAYQRLHLESGVHRVQRVPTTEKSGRIHTSAASVVVIPEAQVQELTIDPKDLRVDTFRASGHGGQSVQKTESAVRITHIPTGLVVTSQDERSQVQNREKALRILRSRLLELREIKQATRQREMRRASIGTGDRSEKIRTYNFPQDRVTDHRIKKTWGQLEKIMDGNIDPIVERLLDAEAEAELKKLLADLDDHTTRS
jgi:peptide chain release factor 1